MNRHFVLYTAFTVATLVFISCGGTKNEESAAEPHEEHAHEIGNTVSLSAEQMAAIDVRLGRIEQKQLTASLKANGILQVPNQNKASISSLYGGVIQAIYVQPGNTVKKGQVIATIANPEFIILQEEYLSLDAQARYAELEYNRQKEISGNNAGALKTFQQSETELKTLRARKASLAKQLGLIGMDPGKLTEANLRSEVAVISPMAGSVSSVRVNIGSHVDLTTPIAEVVDNSQLHLDLYIYEKDLPKVRVGQIIHFTLTNNPGQEYDAEVYGIGNTFEDASKALAVHAVVKGDKTGLIDGMNITALVSLENATVPAVPTEAIVNYQGQDYIFIVTGEHGGQGHDHTESEKAAPAGGGTFERIPVRKGTTDVGYSEVTLLRDIPADARVVTNGAFFILAKMTDSGGGHAH